MLPLTGNKPKDIRLDEYGYKGENDRGLRSSKTTKAAVLQKNGENGQTKLIARIILAGVLKWRRLKRF
jgi:hypothetical protein